MKIFLDTANIDQIKSWHETGIIDGVTTNPTHLAKAGGDPKQVIKEICDVVAGDVSVEVTETDVQKVYAQAKEIVAIAQNVVVKIPCHVQYYPIIKKLVAEGVPINITLIFSVMQSLFMAKLGVKYISPFIGRLVDIDVDGIATLASIKDMLEEYGFEKTQLLAASIRSVADFHDAIAIGADVITVPETVLKKATQHPLTDTGITKFMEDWKKLGISQFP